MKGVAKAGGFTIVETMIVLAVTGLLFLSAATLISGKEAKVQFTTAVRDAQSQIQSAINQVQTGYYPNNSDITCSAGRPHQFISSAGSGTITQGTNTGCIFLGKALQFGQTLGGNGLQSVTVYTISGNRQDLSGAEATSISSTYPTVVTNATTSFTLQYGLTAVCIAKFPAAASPTSPCQARPNNTPAVVAFLSSLGSAGSTGDLLSGAQNVEVYPVSNTNIGDGDETNTINRYLASSAAAAPDPPDGVAICFQSGTTNQSGLISIGGNQNGQLSANLQIFSSKDCT